MANLQVRSMDDGLYAALSRRAERDHRSISQEVVAIIQEFLSRPSKAQKNSTQAFLELADSWHDERKPEDIVADMRKARRTKRFKDIF